MTTATLIEKCTAFIATNDPYLRQMLVRSVSKPEDIKSFEDGYRLLEALADSLLDGAKRPQLLVADVILHGCMGLSLVEGLRELGWNTPVALIAHNERELRRARPILDGKTRIFLTYRDVPELLEFVAKNAAPTWSTVRRRGARWTPELAMPSVPPGRAPFDLYSAVWKNDNA